MKKQLLAILGAGILVFGMAGFAKAAPFSFYFSGILEYVDPVFSSAFSKGDSFSGIITYELSTLDSDPALNHGSYANPIIAFTANIGSWTYSLNEVSLIDVNDTDTPDTYNFLAFSPTGPAVDAYFPILLELFFNTYLNPTAVVGDALPSTAPVLSDFTGEDFWLALYNGSYASGIGGSITSILPSQVPEPATMLLLGFGLLGLAGIRRKIKK